LAHQGLLSSSSSYPGQNDGSSTEITECPKKLRELEFFGFLPG
jgi:hypothetical protein